MEIVNLMLLSLSCLILGYALLLIIAYEIYCHIKRPKSNPSYIEIQIYIDEIEKVLKC